MGEWGWEKKWNGLDNTLDPAAHCAYAAWAFMYYFAPRASHRGMSLDLTKLPPINRGSRRRGWMYRFLVVKGYQEKRCSPHSKTSLISRLGKTICEPPNPHAGDWVSSHLRLVGHHATPARWNLHLALPSAVSLLTKEDTRPRWLFLPVPPPLPPLPSHALHVETTRTVLSTSTLNAR